MYFGVMIGKDGTSRKEIKSRINQAKQAISKKSIQCILQLFRVYCLMGWDMGTKNTG